MVARPASNGRLVLAGEATSVTHPATAHGAFLSGACDSPTFVELLAYENDGLED